MHILVVTDQHPESLGGVQVAIRMQRRALERLGHRVTVAAPALHRRGHATAAADREAYIDLPSRPITRDREYGITWPGRRTDRALARALAERPPVDLVHVQGDFWGAMTGVRAARGLRAPIVHTMHNHVDEGTRAVTPLAPLAFAGLRVWRRLALGGARGAVDRASRGAWRYLAELAAEADAVTAPSQHFADALQRHGVSTQVLVTPNGVDDEAINAARRVARSERRRPKLVWLGRMSHEKRVLEFIDAIGRAQIDADVTLHGAGLLLSRVEERIAALGLADRVTVAGPVPYASALAALRDADALVQTSIGFETQGLTPFEAAALGTPTVFSDAEIAEDVDVAQKWVVADGSVDALARTLRQAVSDLAARPGALRVDETAAPRFLQSARTAEMLAVYEAVLTAGDWRAV
ncbi:glycosyltransferase [Leucobacter chromiiresistens]|uniref:D-inositol 3-phosphate glycosyltransferase n=3 Tax=Leucobacter chromiiresistens TaxID=1079994 RepID=A0A1H0XXQ7_9MICO|nr:glycosyltransferase [Leucobacter chromiiresistens]SDQ07688.1 Glycosyltransferase involved in cell wall bisynthesis [Leucobacter chromiiresistens]